MVGDELELNKCRLTSSCSGRVMDKVPSHIDQRAAAELRR